MKTTVIAYSNDLGSLVHYSVRTWTTQVYAVERFVLEGKLTEEQKEALTKPGVYLLVNENQVYIGQSQNILTRWKQHLSSDDKEWFDCAYAITDLRELHATDLNALEYLFHSKAVQANRFVVMNDKLTDNQKSDYETEKDYYDTIFDNVNTLLNSIYRGHRVFNQKDTENTNIDVQATPDTISLNNIIFHFSQAGCSGKLKKVNEGWLLLKEAQARTRDYKSTITDSHTIRAIDYHIKYLDGKLDSSLKTTEDILFSSPSAPVIALMQQTANGWRIWKDDNGNTLEKYR